MGAELALSRGVPRGHFARSRSLADLEARFGAGTIQKFIASRGGEARVLEIGCGEGRALMELHKAFPGLALHGINLEPWPEMQGSESFRKTAVHYGIYDEAQAAGIALPEVHFYDASELRFPDGHFDVVMSQVTVPYIPRKANFLEEVWRSLKPGGMAFLHIDSTRHEEADFLSGDTPCFVVYRDKKRIGVAELLAGMRAQGFDLRYGIQRFRDSGREQMRFLLIMTKSKDEPLRLHLTLDPHSSFDLTRLHKTPADWKSLWGFRSVYR